jgi:hypothetical protein
MNGGRRKLSHGGKGKGRRSSDVSGVEALGLFKEGAGGILEDAWLRCLDLAENCTC